MVRNGYANGNGISLEYNLAYDTVGKNTAVSIGSQIASVSYTNQDGTVDILPADGYTYDAWGNEVGSSYEKDEGLSKTLYDHNALKYRGYYYDTDPELYYLNTRFYDPVIGRFISADDISVLSVDQENFLQYNLYAYCFNNPVNNMDSLGMFPWLFLAKVAIGGAISAISYGISCHANGEEADLETMVGCFIIGAFCSAIDGIPNDYISKYTIVVDLAKASVSSIGNMATTIGTGGSVQEGIGVAVSSFGFGFAGSAVFGKIKDIISFDGLEDLVEEITVGGGSEGVCSILSSYKGSVKEPSSSYLNGSRYLTKCRAPEGMTLCERRAQVLAAGGVW